MKTHSKLILAGAVMIFLTGTNTCGTDMPLDPKEIPAEGYTRVEHISEGPDLNPGGFYIQLDAKSYFWRPCRLI